MKRFVFVAAIGMLLSQSAASAAVITVYDGVSGGQLKTDWITAVGAFTTEDFTDGLSQDFTTTGFGSGHDPSPGPFGIWGGEFHDRLLTGIANRTEIVFSSAITAFGANWDLAGPGGAGLGIAIDAGGTPIGVDIPNSYAGTFFGFTSDTAFTKIILTGGSNVASAETFDMDDAVYSTSTPEPVSMALLGLTTLGGIGLRLRRNRKAQDAPAAA